MDLLKRNLFFILCALGAAGGVALGWSGLGGMPKVMEEMQKVESMYSQLQRLQGDAVSKARILAEQKRIDLVLDDRDKVFARAKELYGYEPLVAEVLPGGGPRARTDFQRRYGEAMTVLLDALNYGGHSVPGDVRAMEERITNEKLQAKEIGLDRGAVAPRGNPIGPLETPAGVLTTDGVRENAVARARIAAAQRIFCFAQSSLAKKAGGVVSALQFHDSMIDTGTVEPPELFDVWHAQLGYWIQKDVVAAIAAINEQAAEQVRSLGGDPWVGTSPVKEVISIRVSSEYVDPEGDSIDPTPPGGYDEAIPPESSGASFAGTGSTNWYNVLQFTVKLIMDQRDIPLLVDRLSKDSFYTLLQVGYKAVARNRKMTGKVYGSEPVVNVVLDFETALLGEVFLPMMPQEVCEYYDLTCSDPVAGEDENDD